MEQRWSLQQMVLKQLYIHMQKMNLDLTPITKINSKWVVELGVQWETIKLLKDNMEENQDHFGYCNTFSDTTPKT